MYPGTSILTVSSIITAHLVDHIIKDRDNTWLVGVVKPLVMYLISLVLF